MSINALLSSGDGSDESVDLAQWRHGKVSKDELLWIDLESPSADELETVRDALRLSEQAADALEADATGPDAAVLDGATAVVVLALADEIGDEPLPLLVMLGEGWVLTRHDGPMPFLEDHRRRISDEREIGLLAPVQFMVSILDWHVDAFFRAAETLESEVDDLDDAALRTEANLLDRLVTMRRRIARIRRILRPHRELFAEMERPDFLPDLDESDSRAIADVGKRLERAGEAVAHAREMLIGTFDVHMTRTAQRTNDIIRVLTWASVILLPAVVLAGIMGMNFDVPLFDISFLFFVVIGFMVLLAIGTLAVARWRRWL
ncbi:MAG: magnesium transporter CorA family protein [Candidatus Limnocylindria bacterium]